MSNTALEATSDCLLTPREAAARLSVSLDTLEAYVSDGTIPFVNVARENAKVKRRRFRPLDIERFVADRFQREAPCQSTKPTSRHIINTRSRSNVIGFRAARNARLAERQKQKSGKSTPNAKPK